jgi:coniferyl-aldehyde dehydrogenase
MSAAVTNDITRATPEASSASGVPDATDMSALLQRMQAAQRKSGAPSLDERMGHLERLRRALLKKKTAIAEAISRDFGNRSRHETLLAEIFTTVQGIEHTRQNLASWMEARERDVGWAFVPASAEVVYQPLGVVGIISPWNYPLLLALSPLTGALAAGNRAILKPSELTPESSLVLKDLIAEVFAPDHVSVVTGDAELGSAFARLPFDHLVFTGSTRVGKLVMRAAADNLTPLTLELGGKSPVIVGEDAGLRAAARGIAYGKLLNAGQTCLAPDYALVPEGKKDAFVTEMKAAVAQLYPTLAKNPDYTSILNDRHLARLEGYLTDAKDKGATVASVNPANEELDAGAHKLAPTLVTDVNEEMALMQEEIFGPILPIKTYKTLDEAIDYVNDHPRPLALYYFGSAGSQLDQVITHTISGGVSVNATLLHIAQDDLPFGGVGASGMGHYHGREGFETFSKKKPIFYESRINASAVRAPPFGKLVDSFLRFVLGK